MDDAGTSTCGTSTCGTQGSNEKTPKGSKKTRLRLHGDDELYFQPTVTEPMTSLDEYDGNYPASKIAEGGKLAAALTHIRKWQAEAPDDKIIGKAVAEADAMGSIT